MSERDRVIEVATGGNAADIARYTIGCKIAYARMQTRNTVDPPWWIVVLETVSHGDSCTILTVRLLGGL